jgi:hypothetical protein
MQRIERSVAMLTGLIIAALYVVLLIGVSRESYMRREADVRAEIATTRRVAPASEDVPKRVCRVELACSREP